MMRRTDPTLLLRSAARRSVEDLYPGVLVARFAIYGGILATILILAVEETRGTTLFWLVPTLVAIEWRRRRIHRHLQTWIDPSAALDLGVAPDPHRSGMILLGEVAWRRRVDAEWKLASFCRLGGRWFIVDAYTEEVVANSRGYAGPELAQLIDGGLVSDDRDTLRSIGGTIPAGIETYIAKDRHAGGLD